MIDSDIVFAKIGIIQRCLHRIQNVTGLRPETLENVLEQDVFVLNLQRAAQAAIDLAAHVVASQGLGIPQDLKEHFRFLSEAGIIDDAIADRMKKMIGFRNIAVHEYQTLNVSILKRILTENLKDLELFYTSIITYFKLSR